MKKPRLADRFTWVAKHVRHFVGRIRNTVLGLGGLGCLNASVWINSVTWGLVATGATLLIMQYLTDDEAR